MAAMAALPAAAVCVLALFTKTLAAEAAPVAAGADAAGAEQA